MGADTRLGMDESFAFRAPSVPPYRRVDPRVVRAVAATLVVLSALTAFSRWVIDSEHRSEARAAGHVTDEPMVGMLQGAAVEEAATSTRPVVDATARAGARTALETARRATHGKSSVADAGPGQLSAIERSLIFTDGPSRAPGIASVATDGERWAAAVMGGSGTCYWVVLAPGGTSFGSGELCTGLAALSAKDPGWS